VEQQIRGRELTVAFLDDEILPAIEIVAASAYYDYHAKYESNATQYRCPAPLTGAEAKRLAELVRLARDALGCSGWGRVDLLWDETGPKLLEINTAPGMTDHSLVPMAAPSTRSRCMSTSSSAERFRWTGSWTIGGARCPMP